jgi:transposase-like protein
MFNPVTTSTSPPQCPSCGSWDIKIIFSEDGQDELDEGWFLCQACGEEWDDSSEEGLESVEVS